MTRVRNIYLPLLLIVVYIVFGYGLSIVGPMKYKDYWWEAVGLFLAVFCVIFSLGFALGVRSLADLRLRRLEPPEPRPGWMFKVLLLGIGMIYIGMASYSVIQGQTSYSLTSAGEHYIESYKDYVRNTGSYSFDFIFFEILYLPTMILVAMGYYYFMKLSSSWKLLFVLFIVGYVVHYVLGMGKQKQLGDLVIVFVAVLMVKFVQSGKRISWWPKIALAAAGVAGILAFSALLGARYAAADIGVENFALKAHPLTSMDLDNWLFHLLGSRNGFPFAMFSSYFTNGYYGLSLAMHLDFQWTMFIGNSYSVMVVFNKFFGFDFLAPYTYPYRVGEMFGWGQSKWHSAFAWLASDLTFPGTLLLFGPIGYLWGKVWVEAVALGRRSSIVLFGILLVGLIFLPANNQLVHSPGSLLAFYSLLIYTLFLRDTNRTFLRRRGVSARWGEGGDRVAYTPPVPQ